MMLEHPNNIPKESSGPRRIVLRLVFSAAVFILLILFLEGGARLYLGDRFVPGLPTGLPVESCAQFDPDLGWVNKPGVRTRVVAARFAYDVEINSKGLRDREHEYEPPDGVFRIALLGDSQAWGWGVNNGECFADLLEERLSPGVEVINLAVPGFGTDQELWMLNREGWKYRPDLVLLCMILNDLDSNGKTRSSGMAKPCYIRDGEGKWVLKNHPVKNPGKKKGSRPGVGFLTWLHAHSAFTRLFSSDNSNPPLAVTEDQKRRIAKREKEYSRKVASLCDELVDPGSATHMLLRRMAHACKARNVPLFIFSIAHHHDRFLYEPGYYVPPEVEALPEKPDQPFKTTLSRRLEEAGRIIDFNTFSLDQAMLDEMHKGVPLHVGDAHLNQRGNELVAEQLERILGPHVK